jgi:hypothetical protein
MNWLAAPVRACTGRRGRARPGRNGTGNPMNVLQAGQVGAAPWLRVLQVLLVVLAFAAGVARAETWDVISFEAPAGGRQTAPDVVGFAEATPTTFVTYAIYKSARSSGDPARDFQDEWQLLMREYRLVSELKSGTGDWGGGWKLTMGTARVWGEQQRNFTAVLSVFTGHGVKASILIRYNDERYKPSIDKFVASWRLQAPSASQQTAPVAGAPDPQATAPAAAGGAPVSLTSNEWYRSVASTWAKDGYLRYRYRFAADGTYSFVKEWWSQYHHTDYWFIEESGRYRTDGGMVHVTPSKAVKILRDKAGQAKGRPETLALEKAAYRYRFDQLLKPTLILTPASGQPTDRDGKAFSFAGDGKSYYYEPPSPCEQRPAPADCP